MRFWGLCKRNLIETLRDPITIVLALGLPIFLLVLFSVINLVADLGGANMFEIGVLTPGIIVFSFSMLMMSEGNLIAEDRNTSLFARLNTLPLRTSDFMFAYSVPYLIIAVGQFIVTYIVAFCFGLPFSPHIFTSFLIMFPIAVIFIAAGLMMGVSLNLNQVIGIGNGLVIVIAMLSGAWMPIAIMGRTIEIIATIFPFYNAVEATRELIVSGYGAFEWLHIWILLAYTVGIVTLAFFVSRYKLKTK